MFNQRVVFWLSLLLLVARDHIAAQGDPSESDLWAGMTPLHDLDYSASVAAGRRGPPTARQNRPAGLSESSEAERISGNPPGFFNVLEDDEEGALIGVDPEKSWAVPTTIVPDGKRIDDAAHIREATLYWPVYIKHSVKPPLYSELGPGALTKTGGLVVNTATGPAYSYVAFTVFYDEANKQLSAKTVSLPIPKEEVAGCNVVTCQHNVKYIICHESNIRQKSTGWFSKLKQALRRRSRKKNLTMRFVRDKATATISFPEECDRYAVRTSNAAARQDPPAGNHENLEAEIYISRPRRRRRATAGRRETVRGTKRVIVGLLARAVRPKNMDVTLVDWTTLKQKENNMACHWLRCEREDYVPCAPTSEFKVSRDSPSVLEFTTPTTLPAADRYVVGIFYQSLKLDGSVCKRDEPKSRKVAGADRTRRSTSVGSFDSDGGDRSSDASMLQRIVPEMPLTTFRGSAGAGLHRTSQDPLARLHKPSFTGSTGVVRRRRFGSDVSASPRDSYESDESHFSDYWSGTDDEYSDV